jgi:putative glutamine amidotransferase
VKPVVAVSAPRRSDGGRERVALNAAYVAALSRAGLVPLVVPPMLDPADATEVIERTAGLVLTGGEDVEPARYGAAPHPRLGAFDPVRDVMELALIGAARARHRPLLAICRGIQILNVALGGTLYQDLASERPGPVEHQDEHGCHAIRVAPGSLSERVLGATRPPAQVNSRHHQAVRDLAPGLIATAWAPDGLVEAVEYAPSPAHGAPDWMLAVQWHPEDLTETALFAAFARAVA